MKIFKTKCQLCGKEIVDEEYFSIECNNSKRKGDVDFCSVCNDERLKLIEEHRKTTTRVNEFMMRIYKILDNRA